MTSNVSPLINNTLQPMSFAGKGTDAFGFRLSPSPEAASAEKDTEQTAQELQQLTELRERERDIRMHEQAHFAAGGEHVRGGMHLEIQKGPKGALYAVGGKVNLDTSPVPDDPTVMAEKAQPVRQAAMAPAEPSPEDRNVAAEASAMEAQARMAIQLHTHTEGNGAAPSVQQDARQSSRTARVQTQRAVLRYTEQEFPSPGSGFSARA